MEVNELERLRSLGKSLETLDEFQEEYVRLLEINGTIMVQLRLILHEQTKWLADQFGLLPKGEC